MWAESWDKPWVLVVLKPESSMAAPLSGSPLQPTTAHGFNTEQRQYGIWTRIMMEMGQIVIQNEGSRSEF